MRVHLFVPSDPEELPNAVASGADALWLEGPVEASALRAARQQAANLKLYRLLEAASTTISMQQWPRRRTESFCLSAMARMCSISA